MKNRILALFLVLCMVATMLPMSMFAVSADPVTGDAVEFSIEVTNTYSDAYVNSVIAWASTDSTQTVEDIYGLSSDNSTFQWFYKAHFVYNDTYKGYVVDKYELPGEGANQYDSWHLSEGKFVAMIWAGTTNTAALEAFQNIAVGDVYELSAEFDSFLASGDTNISVKQIGENTIKRYDATIDLDIGWPSSASYTDPYNKTYFFADASAQYSVGGFYYDSTEGTSFPGTMLEYWHKVLFVYDETKDVFVVNDIETAGAGNTEYSTWRAGLNNLVVIAYPTAPCYSDMTRLEIGDELTLVGTTFERLQQGSGSPDDVLEGAQLIFETTDDDGPSYEYTDALDLVIKSTKCYDAGETLVVRVETSNITIEDGISGLGFTLNYDSDKLVLLNDLDEDNDNGLDCIKYAPAESWENLSNVKHTVDADGNAVALNDGVINVIAATVSVDTADFANDLNNLTFEFQFEVKEDITDDIVISIPTESILAMKNTETGFEKYSGDGTERTFTAHYTSAVADCTTEARCDNCGLLMEAALGHTPNIEEATCTEDKVCTVCGEVLAEKLGHNFDTAWTYDDDNHWHVCLNGCDEVSDLGAHEFDGDNCECGYEKEHVHVPGAEATCTTAQVCTTCGEVLVEALGHTAGAAADCENDQTCTVCGEVLVEALGHTPGAEATCTTAQVCTVCGETLVEALGHTPGAEATCTTAQVCTVCGETLVEALGHTPGAEATCTTAQVCTVCGETLVEALGHTPGAEATCTTAQVCTVCGETLVEALGHTPGAAADCENDQTCTVCGEVLANKLGHNFDTEWSYDDNNHWHTCANGCGEIEDLAEHTYTGDLCECGYERDHVHVPGAEATCTDDQICTACGVVLVPALGHTPGAEATCTDDQICTVCTVVLVPALGHTPGAEADCTTAQVCTVCKVVLAEALGHTAGPDATCTEDQTCTVCGEVLAEKLGHTPGAEATCTTAQVCTVCGETLVEALGHTPGAEATCTTAQVCTVCGETLVEALGHTPGAEATCTTAQVCTVCGETLVEALGHTPGAEATCTTAQVCTVCGETLVEALGHTPGAEATCTTAQVCTVCGETLVEALGHTPGAEATCTTAQVCTVCGETLVEALGHTPGAEATCTTAQVCTVCGETLVEALGHTPGAEATCTTAQVCTVCGETLVEALGHTPGAEATCTTAQVCTVCGETLVEALGHTPGAEATCTTAQVCTVCGETLVEALGHTPGAEATCTTAQVCTVCGETLVEALGHTPGAEATCTTAQVCTVCGETLVEALGHTAGDWEIVTEPDYGAPGLREKHCTVCGELLESEVIPALEAGLGDVDGDGDIDATDYIFVRRHVMGTYTLEGDAYFRADIDNDGEITFVDYIAIKRAVMGTYVIEE